MIKMRSFLMLCNLILIVLAIGTDIYSLRLIIDVNDSINEYNNLLTALCFHLFASAIGAYSFSRVIASSYIESPVRIFIFFFVILFYLPVLGLVGLTLTVLMMPNYFSRPEEEILPINLHKIRDLSASNASNILSQLENINSLYRSRNPERRLTAVYATLKIRDQDAIPLLRMALSDSVDDIRLLAYALLDRKENKLSKNIKKLKQQLENKSNIKNKFLYQKIANDYLELARLGLVQGETQNYVLKMACKYIELGLKFYPKDAGFCFQYGQALLKLRKYQQAYEQFKKAESFGIDREKLLVYYAELAFYHQNYLEVRDIMKTLDFPTAHPKLSTIANFWQKPPNAATAQR